MNVAIVTGASSGMGKEFVLQLGRYVQVDEIWVIARRKDALLALQQQVTTPIRAVCLDLLQQESFESFCALLEQE